MRDVNDNSPIFLGTPYSFQVREVSESQTPSCMVELSTLLVLKSILWSLQDQLVGTVVYSGISIRDSDIGSNGEIQSLVCYSPAGDSKVT